MPVSLSHLRNVANWSKAPSKDPADRAECLQHVLRRQNSGLQSRIGVQDQGKTHILVIFAAVTLVLTRRATILTICESIDARWHLFKLLNATQSFNEDAYPADRFPPP